MSDYLYIFFPKMHGFFYVVLFMIIYAMAYLAASFIHTPDDDE